MGLHSASTMRPWGFRSEPLSLANTCLIGLQVSAVGRQVPQRRSRASYGRFDACDLVQAQANSSLVPQAGGNVTSVGRQRSSRTQAGGRAKSRGTAATLVPGTDDEHLLFLIFASG